MPERPTQDQGEMFPEIAEKAKKTTPARERVKKKLRNYIRLAEERLARRKEEERKERIARILEDSKK